MGIAAEVPDHIGSFNLKYIPYTVIANIFSLVEGEVQIVNRFSQLALVTPDGLLHERVEEGH